MQNIFCSTNEEVDVNVDVHLKRGKIMCETKGDKSKFCSHVCLAARQQEGGTELLTQRQWTAVMNFRAVPPGRVNKTNFGVCFTRFKMAVLMIQKWNKKEAE